MPVSLPTASTTLLEERLQEDIRRRGLKPGDRYLTSEEAAVFLDVSRTTASRAMRQLASRNVLERRRKLGTLIGPKAPAIPRSVPRMRIIQVLLVNDLEAEYATQELVLGLRTVMPDASVQLNFMPKTDAIEYVADAIEVSASHGRLLGIVALSVPREVHRYLQGLALPVVVLGSVFPEGEALPSVDCDNEQVGELIVDHAVEKVAHPRIALLALSTWTAGDNALLNGIMRALSKHSLPADSLIIRSIPEELAESEIRRLVADGSPPNVYFCRKQIFANVTISAVKERGMSLGKDVHVIGDAYPSPQGSKPPYPYVMGHTSYQASVEQAARMLLTQINGQSLSNRHLVVPVTLCRVT